MSETIHSWLTRATAQLSAVGIATARLDCLVLLEDILGEDRANILAHLEATIPSGKLARLNKKVAQRAKHMPLAYIRGKVPFFGRELLIKQGVLVPRPETETMIELLKQATSHQSRVTILDIGTGSGAIAITAKLELPKAKVIATDIDVTCLKLAQQNAAKLGADVQFLRGDLLQPIHASNFVTRSSILLTNLPYVPEHYSINQAAEHEPKHAIFGGKDGLNLYRRLWVECAALPIQPRLVITESLPFQHDSMTSLAQAAGYQLHDTRDFIQVFAKS